MAAKENRSSKNSRSSVKRTVKTLPLTGTISRTTIRKAVKATSRKVK